MIQGLNVDSALSLSVLQMQYFGVVIAKIEDSKLSIVTTEKSKNLDSFKALHKDKTLEINTIDEHSFNSLIEYLQVEEQINKYKSSMLQEINDEITQDSASSAMNLLTLILQESIYKNASDIHFEKDMNNMRIRLRVDGILIDRFLFEEVCFAPLSLCLKLISNLEITENSVAQDGRFSFNLKRKNGKNNEFDFRVSTLPLIDGESIVLRILDKNKTILTLDNLGFCEAQLQKLEYLYNLPYGLILVTGPTGSGKSTTLYGMLNIIKNKNLKIITIEDPVEYRLQGISQVAINHKVSFSNVLRNVLRQDPDVIMIGEVRDKETLKIAIQAAFTGHLVFATLHTNDSLDAISRILELGLEPYFISQALSGIISQRLIRKLCTCKEKTDIGFIKKACQKCSFTGYKDREVIAEILLNDESLSDFINGKITKSELLEIIEAKHESFSLTSQAMLKVKSGITDIDEVYRVVK